MTNILIADDHAIVRQGLKQIIDDQADMRVGAEAESGSQVLELMRQGKWDLVVTDMTMPGRSGLEIIEEIKRSHPEVPVLVLSIHPEEQYALRALKAGASGYLTKDSAPEELVAAIRKLLAGRKHMSEALAELLADRLAANTAQELHEVLSKRELQVLIKIASGRTVTEIADELSLSAKTVSTYRTRILEKMHLKNNAELMRYAITAKLLD